VLPQPILPGIPGGHINQRIRVMRVAYSPRVVGIDISYGAPWEALSGKDWKAHLWRNRPCCFMHFEIYAIKYPATRWQLTDAHPATLGGHRGRFAPGDPLGGYSGRLFFANHVCFFWRQGAIEYVATLHSFGPGTTKVLGALIASLQPAGGPTPPAIAAS
jgi:hypothetical protein